MKSNSLNDDLKKRTKYFAVRIIRLYSALPKSTEARVLGRQLRRCGTSVGAQYREAQHAKSDADFISKIEGSLQELAETSYWLELLEEMSFFSSEKLRPIRQETDELTAIPFAVILHTLGKVQEWLNWQHWKCCEPQKGSVGSNPTLSAISILDRGF